MNQEELKRRIIELVKTSLFRHIDKSCLLAENIVNDLIENGVTIRERGEWEWFEEWSPSTPEYPREIDNCGWRCNKCKIALEDSVGGYWDDYEAKPTIEFCPHCGADMRGVSK